MAQPGVQGVTPGGQTGLLGSTFIQTDLAKKSFAGNIARLFPNGSSTLFGLTSMLKDETALQYEHGFFSKTMIFPSATVVSGFTAGTGVTNATNDTIVFSTTAPAVGTTNIIPGMLLQVMQANNIPTGEVVLVSSVTNGTTAVIQRNVSNNASLVAGISAGLVLYQIGSAYAEASNRPNAVQIVSARITNYTQIFRNTWTISDSVRATQVIAGDSNVAESRNDCAAFHAADIEKSIFFGRKSILNSATNQPLRTMDGLQAILENASNYPAIYAGVTNVRNAAATTTQVQLEAMLDPLFDQATDPKSGNDRLMFVGGAARRVINRIGQISGQYQLTTETTTWGLQFSTWRTARGSFKIIEHPLFNSNAAWAKLAVSVDPAAFSLAYLGDRKTQNREFNISMVDVDPVDNGIDAVGGTLTTECTVVLRNPPACGMIWGLTAAA